MAEKVVKKTNKEITPLSVMLGSGDFLTIKNKKYAVKPMPLQYIEEFMEGGFYALTAPIFYMTDENGKKKIDKCFSEYCFDSDDNPFSLKKAFENEWDVEDLQKFLKKLCNVSG